MPLYTLTGLNQSPTILEAATMLGTTPDAVDPNFGIILIDPTRGRYCVNVHNSAQLDQSKWIGVEGPWSDPGVNAMAPTPGYAAGDGSDRGSE